MEHFFLYGKYLFSPSLYFRFATRQRDALLFYNGRYNEKHDFIALELVDGQPQFSFSLGDEVTRVQTNVEGGVSDGQWQTVTVDYFNRVSNTLLSFCK